MTRKTSRLESLQIPKPCPSDWERMIGSERKRFCTECHKYVYNLSAMTRREAEALIEDSQGKVCARFTRLADGQVLTQEPPITLHRINRRPSPIAAALVTAMISLTPTIAAPQASTHTKAMISVNSKKKTTPLQTSQSTGTISGVVKDPMDAVIVGAQAVLTGEGVSETQTTSTGDDGTFRFEGLADNTYNIKVESPGFIVANVHGILIRAGESQKAELSVIMSVAALGGEIVTVEHPLRSLYTNSDRVVIARVGESAVVETAGESRLLMTTLDVSSTLKGAQHKATIYLYHSSYGDEQRLFQAGDQVLLFLTQREPQKKQKAGYELFDSSRGVKKLSGADLKVYTQHINELSDYLKDGKFDRAELVEWLVRCAEDKATRWEGATELALSARNLRDLQDEQSAEGDNEEVEKVEVQDDSGTAKAGEEATAVANDSDGTDEDSELVAKLSEDQRERLIKALLSVEKFDEGDLELLKVVSYFKDSRLVPFLVSHLHRVESAPPKYAEDLINTLAEFFNDETLLEAAEKYADDVSYDDLEDGSSEAITVDEAKEKKAAIEQRSQLLMQFLSVVEKRLSQPTPLK
jgi:hypothetical protein